MDEMIDIIRGLCDAAASSSTTATHYDFPSIKICPVPTQPIPILIGGHADAALRRAARLGDGWMHAGGDGSDLGALHRAPARSCAASTAASASRSRST